MTDRELLELAAVGFAISDEQNEATALFIAQLNPENILALLDELDSAKRALAMAGSTPFYQ